jgi:hypothetical protein
LNHARLSTAGAASDVIFGADLSAAPTMATNSTFQLGGDLTVNRLGFGAMRITGEGIWDWPADRNKALKRWHAQRMFCKESGLKQHLWASK